MIKCHRSKMGVIYMQSWKQCLLPFSWLSLQWPCGNWCFWAHDVKHIIYMYVFIHIYTTNTHIHTYILSLYLSITYILTIIVKTQMLFFIIKKKEISVFFFWWHVILLKLIRSVYYWVERVTTVTNVIVKCLKY